MAKHGMVRTLIKLTASVTSSFQFRFLTLECTGGCNNRERTRGHKWGQTHAHCHFGLHQWGGRGLGCRLIIGSMFLSKSPKHITETPNIGDFPQPHFCYFQDAKWVDRIQSLRSIKNQRRLKACRLL